MACKPVPPPKGLSAAGLALWRSIADQWAADDLDPDARERALLGMAARETDMLHILEDALDQEVAADRLIVKGSTGQPTTSSLVAETRRSRAQIAQLLLKLGLDEPEALAPSNITAMTAAEAGRLGGMARRRRHG